MRHFSSYIGLFCYLHCLHTATSGVFGNNSLIDLPSQSSTGSLIRCARQCGDISQCMVILYGEVSPPNYDCGYGYDLDDASKATGHPFQNILVFVMNRSNSSVLYPKCMSYVEVTSESKVIVMPANETTCALLIGTHDVTSLLKIRSNIKCHGGCDDNDTVTIYNVREKVADPVSPLDEPEGTVVCQKAPANEITTVFLAANESYALIHISRSRLSDYSVKLEVFQETWTKPYLCQDCTSLSSPLLNSCQTNSRDMFESLIKFHNFHINKTSSLPTSSSSSSTSSTTTTSDTISPKTKSTATTRPLQPAPTTRDLRMTTISTTSLTKTTPAKVTPSRWPTTRVSVHHTNQLHTPSTPAPINTTANVQNSNYHDVSSNTTLNSTATTTINISTNANNSNSSNEMAAISSNNGDDDETDVAVIGGSVAASIVGVVAVSFLVLLLYRQWSRNKVSPRDMTEMEENKLENKPENDGSKFTRVHFLES